MATTDPKTTIYNGVTANIGTITKDDGVTAASVLHIWQSGPETMKYLFYDQDYDVVITYAEPTSRGVRVAGNNSVPVHYNMSYPVTVSTVDKPLLGVLECTASRMQYKVTYALRQAAEAINESAAGASPAYRLTLISDNANTKRVAGVRVYETAHVFQYETSYGY